MTDTTKPTIWQQLITSWQTVPGHTLPVSSGLRKDLPLDAGCLQYAPAALVCFAAVSKIGNDKHNLGEALHHARGKSMDHADCVLRHQLDMHDAAPTRRNDPAAELEEAACRFWRAGVELQEICERLGAPLAPAARLSTTQDKLAAQVKDLRHPAEHMAIEAFKREQEPVKRWGVYCGTGEGGRSMILSEDFDSKEAAEVALENNYAIKAAVELGNIYVVRPVGGAL